MRVTFCTRRFVRHGCRRGAFHDSGRRPGKCDDKSEAQSNAQTVGQAATGSDQQIVVTARRRNELLLDVPVAVTAYSGEQLNRQGALDITDIADTTPNVTLEISRGTNSTLTAFIRGIGQQDPVAGFEQGVGLYLDDVYLNRPQAAVLNIFDVERIEVLRGPQGTLYGRNTIGGAIKYVTRQDPTDGPHFSIRANLGTYHQADLIASVSSPITKGLLVGARLRRGCRNHGFGKNLTTGMRNYNKDVLAARGTIEFDPVRQRLLPACPRDNTWDDSNPTRRPPADPQPLHHHRRFRLHRRASRCSSDVFDTQRRPQRSRAKGSRLAASRCTAKSELTRLAEIPQHHRLSQGQQPHADRLRCFALSSMSTCRQSTRTASSARNSSSSPTRVRCRASPASII